MSTDITLEDDDPFGQLNAPVISDGGLKFAFD
jgi:hypothetical protein